MLAVRSMSKINLISLREGRVTLGHFGLLTSVIENHVYDPEADFCWWYLLFMVRCVY